jgi:predicted MFS family arabinose efflux permease
MENQTKAISDKFTGYQKFVITILALTQFTVVLDFMVMSPLGDFLMKSMELTTKQFGIAVFSYAFSAGISGFLTAGFADSFDRKKLLLFFYIGFIIGTLFCGLATNFYFLVAARVFTGIFGGVIGSISMAIVSDLFPIEKRGRVMGFLQMGFGASQVLGIPISLYIANHFGWQSPFFMIVVLAIIVWGLILSKMKPITKHLEVQNKDTNALQHLIHTIQNRNYRIGFLTTALMSLGGFMIMPWGSVYAINNLHVTKEQLPILFMIAGVATLLMMPLIGKISDKINKFTLFTIASLWMMIVVIIYANLGISAFWIVVVLNVLMMMGVMARMVPSVAMVSELPKLQDRGAFMSVNSSLQQMAGGIAAAIGGMIVTQKDVNSPIEHYDTLAYVVSIFITLCVIMLYRVQKIIKESKSKL